MKAIINILKYTIIIFLVGLGLFLTIFFSKNYKDSDIAFGIGTGIFGSAFIALLIEVLSDFNRFKDIKQQKKFVFEQINSDIMLLVGYEISNFFSYCKLCNEKISNNIKKTNFKDGIVKLQHYIKQIKKFIKKDAKMSHFDENWVKKKKLKTQYLCTDALLYYERLSNNINRIVENKDMYYSFKLITDKGFNFIKCLDLNLRRILVYSKAGDREYTLTEKDIFFEQINESFKLLGIDSNKTIKII